MNEEGGMQTFIIRHSSLPSLLLHPFQYLSALLKNS